MTDATATDRIARLRTVPIFAELPNEALARLLETAASFEAPAGQVIAEAKMAGSGLFVIEEGTVTVEIPGRPVDLGPGEFFGELSLLTDAPRGARVRAKTPIRCLAVSRHDFDRTLAAEPAMAVAMLRGVARRLIDLETH